MENISAILFDLGGTLTTGASLSEALADLADSKKIRNQRLDRPTLLRVGQYIENTIDPSEKEGNAARPQWLDLWQTAFAKIGVKLNSDEVEGICRAHLEHFSSLSKLQPYSLSLLGQLSVNNIPMGLVSNVTGPPDVFQNDLKRKGLSGYFKVIIWSSAIGSRKPEPVIFENALTAMKINAGRHVLMVGDNENTDIRGAQGVGLTTMRVVDDDMAEASSSADHVVARSEMEKYFRFNLGLVK